MTDLAEDRTRLDTARVTELVRCWPTTDPLYIAYHDEEWGRPVLDERGLYERLCLEGFQSGLSWLTILRKREAFRSAFAGFDPEQVARFGERDVERLLGDAGIVRHRGKIEAAIANARATLELREAETPLDDADVGVPRPAEGNELSRRLKAAGFRFVGPTTVYSSMEACGIVNGHIPECWVRDAVEAERHASPSSRGSASAARSPCGAASRRLRARRPAAKPGTSPSAVTVSRVPPPPARARAGR